MAGLDGCGKFRPHRDSIPGPLISHRGVGQYSTVVEYDAVAIGNLLTGVLVEFASSIFRSMDTASYARRLESPPSPVPNHVVVDFLSLRST